jgi:hypothetical protein
MNDEPLGNRLTHLRTPPAIAGVLATLLAAAGAQAQAPDTTTRVTFGGFVAAYYAFDFGRPVNQDRSFASGNLFTTQPARHSEFNVNLAFVEAKLEAPRVRGRFAAQYGTSVQSNYSAEPTRGTISGPSVSQFVQEAVAGYQLTPSLWIDGGIFFSNMGMEGWISRDNPTYTRSLVADYSPYYSTGVKATWQATPTLSVRIDLVNGWQNISETNTDKGVGVRVDYVPRAGSTISYYNFFGNEVGSGRLRTFNGVGANLALGERVRVLGELDVGTQEGADGDDDASWYGLTAILRGQITPKVALSGRFERFDDEDGVVIATGDRLPAFRANGGSIGLDVQPASRLLWRTELRGFANDGAVFPDRDGAPSKSIAVVVTSLGLTF